MHCEICNKKLEIFEKLEKFNLLKCYDCDHLVSDIKADKEYYKETYSNTYIYEKHKNWMNNPNYKLFNEILYFLESKNEGSVIDLGCGNGLLLKYLNKKNSNLDLTGVDIIKNEEKNSKLTFFKKEIFDYLPEKKFAFVISIAVIEHIPKIQMFLEHIKKISNEDCYCIINTINTDSILYKIAYLLYKVNFKTPFLRLYDPHHLNHFSNKSLEKIFNKNDFSIIKKIKTPINMNQIDYPYNNIFNKYFFYFAINVILQLQKLMGKSWLQTVVFKRNK